VYRIQPVSEYEFEDEYEYDWGTIERFGSKEKRVGEEQSFSPSDLE
jgi:hypothetical protein